MHRFRLLATLLLALATFGTAGASADSGAQTYSYLIGTEPLCGLDPSACPAIAGAPNGDTVELAGEGTFSIHAKSATGGGTFVHKAPAGVVVGSGTWTAWKLLGFHSYGSGAVQGLPPEFTGGLALLAVTLDPGEPGGPTFPAVLRVTCVLGDKIPSGAAEGVRLNVKDLLNFNKEVSGFTVFIAA